MSQLLGSKNEQYVIPAYQRRFSWKEKQLAELWHDIDILGTQDTHLLGSIVCLTGAHTAGINQLELVDGQQRLTSLCILLHCIKDRLNEEGQEDEVRELGAMLHAKAPNGDVAAKIRLDSLDADEFRKHVKGETPERVFNTDLAHAFTCLRELVADKTMEDVKQFLYRLVNESIIVRLDVTNAKDAFKLFETINNRGLKLSPPDIIKNFILGNAARFGERQLDLAREKWGELLCNLDGVNVETFFRYFLVASLKSRVRASFVIGGFKKLFMQSVWEAEKLPEIHWYADSPAEPDEIADEDADDPEENELTAEEELEFAGPISRIPFREFINRLTTFAKIYAQIYNAATGNAKLDRRLRNLKMIKSLQSYGFLMSMRAGGCDDVTFEKVLELTEAFMLRRHVCRERSSENESIFGRLCGADPASPLEMAVEVYREFCPTDDQFRESFASVEFGTNLIERARYCLEQIEVTNHGSYQELAVLGPENVHVEHIIPLKIKSKKAKEEWGDWPSYLGDKSDLRHPRYVSRIGNLTLFAGSLNIGASNNPYSRKKAAYKESSIRMTNELPKRFSDFRFAQVDKRSTTLADSAIKLWPIP